MKKERERKISTKEALKKGLSYNEATKKYGIKIRKQYYLTLKKLVKGEELTNSQKRANEEMKRSTKWKKLRDWAEEEGKKKYVRAEGTVVISGDYVTTEKVTNGEKRTTRVYYEYVINTVAYADTGENAEEIAESTLANSFRKAVLEFLEGSALQEGAVRDLRVEFQDDWEYTKVKEIKENEANILEDSFIIEKWNGREYEYTDEITTKFKNILGGLGWKAE